MALKYRPVSHEGLLLLFEKCTGLSRKRVVSQSQYSSSWGTDNAQQVLSHGHQNRAELQVGCS